MPRVGVRRVIRRVRRRVTRGLPRPVRRTRRRTNKMSKRSLVLSGFPKSKMVRLRYVTQTTLDPDNLNLPIAVFRIRANDMFDPEESFGGGQPMGFDQWMINYDHFCVVGSKIMVQFINPSTSNIIPGMCGIMLSDAPRVGSQLNTLEAILENRDGTQATLSGIAGTSQRNSVSTVFKSKTFSAKKFFGHKVIGEDNYRGSSSSSPAEQALFEIYFARIQGNNPGAITILVQVEYIALLTEPRPLDRS